MPGARLDDVGFGPSPVPGRGRGPDGDDHEDPVMSGSRPRSGSAVDSLLLAGVKFATLGSTMANTMILSRSLSLEAYGTYAQGVLVVALCADATVLGLVDAVNFFFNRDSRESVTREYVNAIFVMQVVIGMITAVYHLPVAAGL